MTKTITITPEVMLAIVAGKKVRAFEVNLGADAKITRVGHNPQAGEFWAEVESASLVSAPGGARLQQEFRIEIQK